MGEGTGE